MEHEYWKDIKGWEGLYQISTKKNIRRFYLSTGHQPVTNRKCGTVGLSNKNTLYSVNINKVYDIAFGNKSIKYISNKFRISTPILAFNKYGIFVGRYGDVE